MWTAKQILDVLDACNDASTFPMLDNGYVYPAGTRLSLYRSDENWGMVIEVFGFSPRAEAPDVAIYTFSSQIAHRAPEERYVSRAAYERYLGNNPHNEMHAVYPVDLTKCQDEEYPEVLATLQNEVLLREAPFEIPPLGDWSQHGVEVEDEEEPQVFELCRVIAAVARDQVMATESERRFHLPEDVTLLLELDEWHHPDIADPANTPGSSPAFRQLAEVLVTGDTSIYQPTQPPNTHWENWPDGGAL